MNVEENLLRFIFSSAVINSCIKIPEFFSFHDATEGHSGVHRGGRSAWYLVTRELVVGVVYVY